jgi:ABC-type Fe3+/spermidine/putrescine transport system ATPase subunit
LSAITLEGVTKRFGPVVAVDGLSLAVAQGELVTVLGPSGSGKSTVLNLIAGLTEPSEGRIRIGGRDVTWLPPARRNVGLVFQSYALFPTMSVRENVAFPLRVRGLPSPEVGRRVAEALRLVRLTGLEARRPGQLSGGQQQRVALARAFVFQPEILLLDEPLAALDRKLREEVRVELRHLQRTLGITTLLVTHDQEEALSLSDRLVVLDGGRVQQAGPPDETYRRPLTRFVAGFLGTANFLDGVLERDGARWAIRLPGGVRAPCGPGDAAPGTRVCGLVRPERVRLGPGGQAGVAGTVTDAIYLGQAVRYHVGVAGGPELVAVAADRAVGHPPGSAVTLSWMPEDVWLIPEGPAGAGPRAAEREAAPEGSRSGDRVAPGAGAR